MAVQAPLDETVWQADLVALQMFSIHSNTILPYFQASPFFDEGSNNRLLWNQAMSNINMYPFIQTREAFEERLKTMSGIEFIVAQEPSEMGPGAGTGVWVINKQSRQKRHGLEDEVKVLATYHVVGDHIYMAPSLADLMNARLSAVSCALHKAVATANEAQKWSPSQGRVYPNAPAPSATRGKGGESKEATPMPGTTMSSSATPQRKEAGNTELDALLAEESLAIYLKYGDEDMDENPITGTPGNFHLSSTGRKEKLSVPTGAKGAPLSLKDTPLPPLNTKVAAENPLSRQGKETKSPKSAIPKAKRRKSKGGTNTPTTSTPNTSTPS